MATTSPHHQKCPPVPLAVWPVAQTTAQYQRTSRDLAEVAEHPAKMIPALADKIVTTFSRYGQLVVDPMCGIGTTLIAAAEQGRRAVGVELEARWAELAARNVDHVLGPFPGASYEVRHGDARALNSVCSDLVGAVDLIVTSPPYSCAVGNVNKSAWGSGASLVAANSLNYSTDRSNIGHARGVAYRAAMAEVYVGCFAILRPGGLMVTVTKNQRQRGRCVDLASTTVALATQAGFSYRQHIIALLAAIRDGQLVARPSFWALTQNRRARTHGAPAHLVVHEDVLVFAKPEAAHA